MQQYNTKSIVFNAAAGLLVISSFIFMLRSLFVAEVIPPCSKRYPSPVELPLENDAAPMSPVQLVGMIGDSQRGLYRNAKVVRVRDVSSNHALKITLRPDSKDARTSGEGNGIGFQWAPSGLKGATSACLTYSVYLPEKFEFGEGGILPGLFAGNPASLDDVSDGKKMAAQRLVWRRNGLANIYAQFPIKEGNKNSGGVFLHQSGIEVPRGRWVAVEQELKFNDLGKTNGLSRLYVNGEMKIERRGLEWRKNGKLTIAGVDGTTAYAVPRRVVAPPKETAIYLTSPQLRWN
ncbi:MAG: polysaccharide lyase [Alphaproteobacteria bacterium]|nr:polysaccharide lyase [Alphaproteobacteria bacterium]